MQDGEKRIEIGGYASGSAGLGQINDAIQRAWAQILADPGDRADAAKLLKIPAEDLPQLSPLFAQPSEAGLGVVETAILIVAVDFARDLGYDLLKDVTKDAVKTALKALWNKLVKERVEEDLPTGGIGHETHLPDDIQ
jgi:hypothetical protein